MCIMTHIHSAEVFASTLYMKQIEVMANALRNKLQNLVGYYE
jgi:hypothetical protein